MMTPVMPHEYPRITACLGHRSLFGRGVTKSEIVEIIHQYPTSQWLDLAAKIDGLMSLESAFLGPRYRYAADRLFPPSVRMRAARHPECPLFFPEQLALLRAFAVVYGGPWQRDSNVEMPLGDISRVLLGLTDYADSINVRVEDEQSLERFAGRSWFMNNQDGDMFSLSRAHFMFLSDDANTSALGARFSAEFRRLTGMTMRQVASLGFGLITPFCVDEYTILGIDA
jgi:hypothetical protein